MDMALDFVTIPQAAVALGVSDSRVRVFVEENRIGYEKIGDRYLIPKAEIERFKSIPRQTGRPPQKIL
jgi:excisionase family DNA binding protein